ncbi:serine hydrolase [Flavobacterium sp. 14A]|uniref:serine hydrolase domain-containing protein n=1 Tax=Flavobacterium sp. 14A TaxID=2735896 RepID=UPI001571003C|nr:serine hydrolase domain-containing protein [Flavobacterium sp. 14A]NRT10648.1 CubicO group peptidase (beta-lactamase class C family) [Flavobacterium sp. 14A]
MNILSKITVALSLLLLLSTSCSKAQKSDNDTVKIDSLLTLVSPRPFNGVVLVTQNDSVRYEKAVGYDTFKNKKTLKVNDQFVINSNSKQITAVLILLEVERGTVDLQAPIITYLPRLKKDWAKKVTVHQLLNHTHGIATLNKPLLFEAGTEFKYGNLSNVLLGEIISAVTNKSYTVVAETLFKKLGMKNTVANASRVAPNLVAGNTNDNNTFTVAKKIKKNASSIPAAGVISTVHDLALWNKSLHEGAILKPESYAKMITAAVLAQHDAFGKEKTGYGYGIRINDLGKTKYIGHTGLGDGYASLNVYFPETKTSLVVLENQSNADMSLSYYFGTQIKEMLLKSMNSVK